MNIGTDIISIERITTSYSKFGDKFISRILTKNEQKIFSNRGNCIYYLAKRFAAKEAIAKAIGTGIGSQISFQDIEISNDKNGKPTAKCKDYKISISLSDEKHYAVAFAIIE